MTAPTKTLYKFRVLHGRHSEGGKTYGKGLPAGDVITTEKNLSRIFDHHGMRIKKFLQLGTVEGPAESVPTPVSVPSQDIDDNLLETYQSMTVAELRAHAQAEEIDLGDAAKKDDIILKIVETEQARK